MHVRLSGYQPVLNHELQHDAVDETDLVLDAADLGFAGPLDLAVVAAWGTRHASNPGSTVFVMPDNASIASYIVRMDLVDVLAQANVHIEGHQPRIHRLDRQDTLVELAAVRADEDITPFARRCYKLVCDRIGKDEAVAAFEMVGELLTNAVEHSGTPTPTFAAAQVYLQSRRLAFGIADAGIGIRAHLARNPIHAHLETDASAIALALEPGVTGTMEVRGNGLPDLVCVVGRRGGQLVMRSGRGLGEVGVSAGQEASHTFRETQFHAPGTWASLNAYFFEDAALRS